MIDKLIKKYKNKNDLLTANKEGKRQRIEGLPKNTDAIVRIVENSEKTMFDLLLLHNSKFLKDLESLKEVYAK